MRDEKKKIGARIEKFALLKCGSRREFSKLMNMTPQAFNAYLRGYIMPGGEILRRLNELGADLNWILTGKTTDEVMMRPDYPQVKEKSIPYPLISSISAGPLTEYSTMSDETELVSFHYHRQEGCFALRVKGNSMLGSIEDGDFVLVDTKEKLYNGCIAACRLKSADQIIKRYRDLGEGIAMFYSDNPIYEPMTLHRTEIEMIYPVVRVQRVVYKRREDGL